MIIINLFGEPGAGKSTLAGDIFTYFKKKGYNIEYLQEFAKQKLYEQNKKVFECETYILSKQIYRQLTTSENVDCVVTDSPILLGHIYENNIERKDVLKKLSLSYFKEFDNLNFFIFRRHEYQKEGRFQTEEESEKISKYILKMLKDENIDYFEIYTNKPLEETLEFIEQQVNIKLNNI